MKAQIFYSNKTQRLKKVKPVEFEYNPNAEWCVLNIFSDFKKQKFSGFGGAFTSSAAENYAKMSPQVKKQFIDLMFNKEKGLGYNFCRCTINSCDFSSDEYAYVKEGDESLSTFDISHDKEKIIPLIKAAQETSKEMFLFASPWSPPAYMKDNNSVYQGGKLKPEYFSLWAEYFVKFIKEYEKAGVKINGVTVQNEPMAVQTWESCVYTIEEQIIFVRDYLKPAFKKAGLDDVKIYIWDHNKEHLYECARDVKNTEGAMDCIDGLAFHWYSGEHFDSLRLAHEIAPELMLFESEFCFGGVQPNWRDALSYAYEMIGNFNNYMSASCDWNLVLDENGGPYHARKNGCKAVLHYHTDTDTLEVMPHYYAIKHFSDFVKLGASVLGTSVYSKDISFSAFQNPDGSVVAVIMNNSSKTKYGQIRLENNSTMIKLKPKSITTVVIEK